MTQRQLIFDAPLTPADAPRLSRQLGAVLAVMSDGRWHTLEQIQRGIAGMGVAATTRGGRVRVSG